MNQLISHIDRLNLPFDRSLALKALNMSILKLQILVYPFYAILTFF
jgi:hypothetical protein